MMKYSFLLLFTTFFVKFTCGQIPDVHEEPHHKPIFEYGSFRYLRVEAAPGDTTAMHNHRLPILYLNLLNTDVWLDDVGKTPRTVTLDQYWIGSNIYEFDNPLIHRFAVTGTNPVHIVAVERSFAESLAPFNACDKPIYQMHSFMVCEFTMVDFVEYCKAGAYPAIVKSGSDVYMPGQLLTCTELMKQAAEKQDNTLLWLVLPE
jgi:hypothetical protein